MGRIKKYQTKDERILKQREYIYNYELNQLKTQLKTQLNEKI